MTREEYLSIAESYYSEIEGLTEAPTFYDYEKSLEKLMQKLSCDYMSKQLSGSSVTNNRRKKKL